MLEKLEQYTHLDLPLPHNIEMYIVETRIVLFIHLFRIPFDDIEKCIEEIRTANVFRMFASLGIHNADVCYWYWIVAHVYRNADKW